MITDRTVGIATVAPGTRTDGRIAVSGRPGGGELSMPVVALNVAHDGPVLWVNGVIHGDEPEGVRSR